MMEEKDKIIAIQGRKLTMNKKDPKLTALQFNQCINDQNIHALSNLMTGNHSCIINEEEARIGKEIMTEENRNLLKIKM
jgi:hypothetical protein